MPPIDFQRAERFIAAIPRGRWTSYKEVAIAGGSPNGAQAVGQWLRRDGDKVPHVWRVLTVDGAVADGFVPAGPGVPGGEVQVRGMLEQEGVHISGIPRRAHADQQFRASDWRP